MCEKILLYTAVTSGYDNPPVGVKCFTEKNYCLFKNNTFNAKIFKVLPHLVLWEEKADVFFWVDGSININKPLEYYIETYLKNSDIALFKHPERCSVRGEIDVLNKIKLYNSNKDARFDQYNYYKSNGYEDDSLYECGVIIRRNTEKINKMMETWWSYITAWGNRDQISFPYVISKFPDIKASVLVGNVRSHPDFIFKDHVGR